LIHRDEHRILVVGDDPDTCRNLSDILIDPGYHVDIALDQPLVLVVDDDRALCNKKLEPLGEAHEGGARNGPS